MFLKKLTIHNGSKLIRDISFHKGLNLIVDETKTSDRRESGNNVGKTTILRLIDYCLGSDGKNIYKDPELRDKANTEIEQFLKDNDVVISLTLKEDLESSKSREVEVRRNFLSRRKKILEINGEQQRGDAFPKKLKELIFASTHERPTLRQIIAKNIRDEKNRIANTLKVLHPTTTIEEYEALYLFWLGIEVDAAARKQQLLREQTTETALLKRLKREASLSLIEQSLIVVNRFVLIHVVSSIVSRGRPDIPPRFLYYQLCNDTHHTAKLDSQNVSSDHHSFPGSISPHSKSLAESKPTSPKCM